LSLLPLLPLLLLLLLLLLLKAIIVLLLLVSVPCVGLTWMTCGVLESYSSFTHRTACPCASTKELGTN